MSDSGYLKFRNDRAVPEIRIGVREFNCIGVSPPLDHPHVYINMGEQDAILCPYCATRRKPTRQTACSSILIENSHQHHKPRYRFSEVVPRRIPA